MYSACATTRSPRKPPEDLALRRRKGVRERIAEQASFRCEYCRCPESHSLSTFAIEHIQPEKGGGADEESNLAYSCSGCNGIKGLAVSATDPESGEIAPLFHPRQNAFEEHFIWSEDFLMLTGTTPTGRATVERLKLNRPGVINLRRLLSRADLHP
jgi:hypothetical protein